MKTILFIALAVTLALCINAFQSTSPSRKASSTFLMGIAPKPSGYASTRAGKQAILDRTKKLVDSSSLILTLPFEGVSKEHVDILRKELPAEVTASVVKNNLLKMTTVGTSFEPLNEFAQYETMYVFIPEGKSKATYKSIEKWQKDVNRKEDIHALKCAVMEGAVYTGSQIEGVCSLPTKEELITKIAIGIKSPSLKLGRAVAAVPNKLGRAFGALKKKLEDEASE